jgi:hypothetical protein
MRLHGGRIMKRKVISIFVPRNPICILVCWYTENLLSGFLILLLLELPVCETRLVVTTPATISRDQLSVPPRPPYPPGDFHHFTLFIIFPRVARQHWSLKSTALVVFRLDHEACLWFPGSYFVKSVPFPYSSLLCWNFNLLDFQNYHPTVLMWGSHGSVWNTAPCWLVGLHQRGWLHGIFFITIQHLAIIYNCLDINNTKLCWPSSDAIWVYKLLNVHISN